MQFHFRGKNNTSIGFFRQLAVVLLSQGRAPSTDISRLSHASDRYKCWGDCGRPWIKPWQWSENQEPESPASICGGSVSIGVILRLSVPELTIFSGGVHKFIVTALLDDPAFVEHDDLIAEPAA